MVASDAAADKLREMTAVRERFALTSDIIAKAERDHAESGALDTPMADMQLVDVAPWVEPEAYSEEARVAAVQELVAALESLGFLLIKGHGVPESVTSAALEAGMALGRLPIEAQKKLHPKHYGLTRRGIERRNAPYSLGPPDDSLGNIWPEPTGDLAGFRASLTRYYHEMERLSAVLLRMMSVGLGCSDPETLARLMGRHRGLQSLNYSCHVGAAAVEGRAHTDWGPLTILRQGAPGLEVISRGSWRAVPALPDVFVVNVGDIMERLSNGRFKSTIHQVRRRAGERVSLPFFVAQALEPSDRGAVAPICRPGEEPKFPPISHNEFVANHFEYFNALLREGSWVKRRVSSL